MYNMWHKLVFLTTPLPFVPQVTCHLPPCSIYMALFPLLSHLVHTLACVYALQLKAPYAYHPTCTQSTWPHLCPLCNVCFYCVLHVRPCHMVLCVYMLLCCICQYAIFFNKGVIFSTIWICGHKHACEIVLHMQDGPMCIFVVCTCAAHAICVLVPHTSFFGASNFKRYIVHPYNMYKCA